jgi:hypothetical protein
VQPILDKTETFFGPQAPNNNPYRFLIVADKFLRGILRSRKLATIE